MTIIQSPDSNIRQCIEHCHNHPQIRSSDLFFTSTAVIVITIITITIVMISVVEIYNATKCSGHGRGSPICHRFLARLASFTEILLPKKYFYRILVGISCILCLQGDDDK